ncbi:hypothetical protein BDZ94DRAFT_1258695 [Collybia nuda]|uniref:Uncharacterized protein n=1 Tax=Collybia nuda TaxID=64659 RepID=A0A9P6CF28_9AGAR|nr:hypothetical protein BDZ94DRAFT_1258695 [Collybia nuda]
MVPGLWSTSPAKGFSSWLLASGFDSAQLVQRHDFPHAKHRSGALQEEQNSLEQPGHAQTVGSSPWEHVSQIQVWP